MLILSRRAGEAIKIGDDVTVVITKLERNQVKVGIVAPRETKIVREELLEADKAAREAGL